MGKAHTDLSFSQTSLTKNFPRSFGFGVLHGDTKKSKHFCLLFFV
nr:MAG TPA: hypothetical protein [Caudoviricetes sp.]